MSNPISARKRLLICLVPGAVAATVLIWLGVSKYSPLVGWDITALTYVVWMWLTVWRMNQPQTKAHASTEDPGRAFSDVVLIFASVISIVAIGFMIMQASSAEGLEKGIEVFLGLFSVVASWAVVHTTYTLKYAHLYYGRPEGGVNFNQKAALKYTDFAYLAFTVGLTFQVSDTDVGNSEIRKAILKHMLLSYLFGAVIIATTINTIANLGK
jgi:uncharacterized membrane protein